VFSSGGSRSGRSCGRICRQRPAAGGNFSQAPGSQRNPAPRSSRSTGGCGFPHSSQPWLESSSVLVNLVTHPRNISRPLLALAFLAAVTISRAAEAPPPGQLEGKVEGRTYVSPTGVFKVTIPVLPELGGEISDTPNVVTFEDDFNVHVSIA